MGQFELFDRFREPLVDNQPMAAGITSPSRECSEQAAEQIKSELNALQLEVLDYLRSVGTTGATDEQMQQALSMNPSTQRPRRIELLRKGLIAESSEKRPTRSGRLATVWIVSHRKGVRSVNTQPA